jgi:hypothetical protein
MMRVLMRSAAAILLIAMGFVFGPVASAQVQSPSPNLSQEPQNIPDQNSTRQPPPWDAWLASSKTINSG